MTMVTLAKNGGKITNNFPFPLREKREKNEFFSFRQKEKKTKFSLFSLQGKKQDFAFFSREGKYIYFIYIYFTTLRQSHGKKVWWLKAAATHDFFPDMTKAKFMRGEA